MPSMFSRMADSIGSALVIGELAQVTRDAASKASSQAGEFAQVTMDAASKAGSQARQAAKPIVLWDPWAHMSDSSEDFSGSFYGDSDDMEDDDAMTMGKAVKWSMGKDQKASPSPVRAGAGTRRAGGAAGGDDAIERAISLSPGLFPDPTRPTAWPSWTRASSRACTATRPGSGETSTACHRASPRASGSWA